jgi:nucleotide-binding universal stress UspA family protein
METHGCAGDRMELKIVVATDFSDGAAAAEARTLELARALDAEVLFVHVAVETPLYSEGRFSPASARNVFEAQRRWAADTLNERVATAETLGVSASQVVKVGLPGSEIVKTAEEEKADMVVMGTHGRSGLSRLLLGSVAERVIRAAPCPVLTVRLHDAERTSSAGD